MKYAVVEIHGNRCIGYHYAGDEAVAQEIFENIVRDYGVEPYDELNGLFEDDDGYTVEMVACGGE